VHSVLAVFTFTRSGLDLPLPLARTAVD
jgi:hypothetical protein